jgi:alkaline phosphatase D
MREQPIWETIVNTKPDLFLHLGDVIYPDITDDEKALLDPWPSPESIDRFKACYAAAAIRIAPLRRNVPVMAVWDDHDFGINDGSGNYPLKAESQQLFLDFFGEPGDSQRRLTPGIYDSQIMGNPGERVQVILLDTRYFRTPPTPDTRSREEKERLSIEGRWAPNPARSATILGDAQWRWLAEQLQRPAEVRLIACGYPVVSKEVGRDAWGNFPRERQRLFDLIGTTAANGVIFLSGDVHFSEISQTDEGPYPLLDFTSSALAAPYTGAAAFTNPYRISAPYTAENFGLIEIDWKTKRGPVLRMRVIALDGSTAREHHVELDTLKVTIATVGEHAEI